MCFTSPELRSASSYGHFTAAKSCWSQCHILSLYIYISIYPNIYYIYTIIYIYIILWYIYIYMINMYIYIYTYLYYISLATIWENDSCESENVNFWKVLEILFLYVRSLDLVALILLVFLLLKKVLSASSYGHFTAAKTFRSQCQILSLHISVNVKKLTDGNVVKKYLC